MLRNCEILLVDDDANDIDLALLAFEKYGYRPLVHAVQGGVEAKECLSAWTGSGRLAGHHPRLVILDLKMPKVDGFELLSTIRQDPELSMVPVVVLTSSRMPSDIKKAYRLGCNAYVVKPVAHRDYMRVLQDLINFWGATNLTPED